MEETTLTQPSSDMPEGLEPSDAPGQLYPIGFVGDARCAECHQAQAETFARTAHHHSSRAVTAEIARQTESTELSRGHRVYQVRATADGLQHRTRINDASGDLVSEQAIQAAVEIGSGTHARSYLFRDGSFHVQSPLTWYAEGGWDLSPGFENSSIAPFSREIMTRCVFCHVGSLRLFDENPLHFEIDQPTIGCERCHGGGQSHVAMQSSNVEAKESSDEAVGAIVHPGSLSRDRRDAICAQCHLQGVAVVNAPGKRHWDFRPGGPISANRTDFRRDDLPEFRIVGHVEQMRQSPCYREDASLGCVTCHNPHDPHAITNSPEHHREVCLSCHGEKHRCALDRPVRRSSNDNHCAGCHMPKRPTNVTHAALHDHRIGLHEESYQTAGMTVNESRLTGRNSPPTTARSDTDRNLIPLWIDEELSPLERRRRETLAAMNEILSGQNTEGISASASAAISSLIPLLRRLPEDRELAAAAAMAYLNQRQFDAAQSLAGAITRRSDGADSSAINATEVLARVALQRGDSRQAAEHYRTLSRWRRVSGDHYLLGLCLANLGREEEARRYLADALRMDPLLLPAHERMVSVLTGTGDAVRRRAHQKAIGQIRRLR